MNKIEDDPILGQFFDTPEKKGTAAFSTKILIKNSNRIWWIGTSVLKLPDLFRSLKLAVSYHINKENKDDYFIDEPEETKPEVDEIDDSLSEEDVPENPDDI